MFLGIVSIIQKTVIHFRKKMFQGFGSEFLNPYFGYMEIYINCLVGVLTADIVILKDCIDN